MVRVFGHQHLRQQACGWDAFIDNMRRDRRLDKRLTLSADPFSSNVALDLEHTR
jgi:hypothetical protein